MPRTTEATENIIGPDPDLASARMAAISQQSPDAVDRNPPEHPAVTFARNILSPLNYPTGGGGSWGDSAPQPTPQTGTYPPGFNPYAAPADQRGGTPIDVLGFLGKQLSPPQPFGGPVQVTPEMSPEETAAARRQTLLSSAFSAVGGLIGPGGPAKAVEGTVAKKVPALAEAAASRYAVEAKSAVSSVIRDTQTGKEMGLAFTGPDAAARAAAKAEQFNALATPEAQRAAMGVTPEASVRAALNEVSTDVETAVRRAARAMPGISAEDIIATPEVRQQLDAALQSVKVAPTDGNASDLADALLQQEKARPSGGNLAAQPLVETAPTAPTAVPVNDYTALVKGMRDGGATEKEIADFIGGKPPPPTSGDPPIPPFGGKDGLPSDLPAVSRAQVASAVFRNYVVSNALSPFTLAIKATSDLVKAADTTLEAASQAIRAGQAAQIPGSVRALYGGFWRGVTQDALTAFKNRQYALGGEGKTRVIDQMLSGELGNGAKRFAQAGDVLSLGSPIPRSISALTSIFQRGYRDFALYNEGYAQAVKQGLKGGGADQFASKFMADPLAHDGAAALERATSEANTRTWTNSNPLSRIPGRDKPILGDALFSITPFVNLVTNVAREGLEFVPGLGALAKGAEAFQKGGLSAAEWTRVAQHQFMGAVGTYVLGQKAAVGEVTGDGPNDDNKKFDLIQQGWKPNHTKIGETWYPNIQFGPLAPLLNAVGNTHDNLVYNTAAQDRESVGAKAGSALNGVIKGELDTAHWLDVLLNLSSALNGSTAEQQQFVNQWISLFVPQSGTLKTAERVMESSTPAIAQGSDLFESLRQRFYRQYPPALRPSDLQAMQPGVPRAETGAAAALPFLGSQGTGGAYDGVGVPEGNASFGTDTVLREAARLGALDNTWRKGGVIESPSPTIGKGDNQIRLDALSAAKYIQMVGEQRQKIVGAMVSSSKYQNATPTQQQALYDQALTRANDFGKSKFLAEGVVDATEPKLIVSQAVEGFRAQGTNKDRAYWVALLDRAGKLSSDVVKAIDSLKEPLPGERIPITVDEYRKAAPLIHEYLAHVPFGTDSHPIGTLSDWTAVAAAIKAKDDRVNELTNSGMNRTLADARAQQEVLASLRVPVQRNLFLNGTQLENPQRTLLARRNPMLSHYVTNKAPNESEEAYKQFPLSAP